MTISRVFKRVKTILILSITLAQQLIKFPYLYHIFCVYLFIIIQYLFHLLTV